jgi:glutamate-1-semialdehyde 2,1-aminomutase
MAIWQKNRAVMPAGVGSLFRLSDPFPMVVKRAKGARMWDADDNEYLDCNLGFSTLILGNAPDEVEAAIRRRRAARITGNAMSMNMRLRNCFVTWCQV